MHVEKRFRCTSTPLSDVRFPIDKERPLTALKKPPPGNAVERDNAKPSTIGHADATTSTIWVPVIVSRASSMRLGRVSGTIKAIRWGPTWKAPYLSRAWMCPQSESFRIPMI